MTPVHVDGRLTEAAWADAPVAGDFVQRLPVEGAPEAERTEVKILFDDRAVYVGARLFDREPHTIARQLMRRDSFGPFDFFEVAFDTNRDRRTAYLFNVSAANQQRDEYWFDDSQEDDAWDAVWESAVQMDSLGWSVEIRIPLSQMQYESADEVQSWGVNFIRRRLRTNEVSHFSLMSRLQRGTVSQFGEIEGILITRPARRLEARPYVLSSAFASPVETGDPFASNPELYASAGLDARVGLGSQFTLNATVNPDFGQVEADPAVINLSAFETFFQERRPFFVEGAQIFDYQLSGGRNRLFYSRRIGRSPHGDSPEDAEFSDVTEAVTILGAAKVTGRTAGGTSVGALAAVTQLERGRGYFAAGDSVRVFMAEPRTDYGVLRVQQDFNGGASTIGAMTTLLRRGLPADGTFDFLPHAALGFGVDWELQWADRGWAFFGYAAGSHIRGDSTAMIEIQQSSNHYFQRPDSRWVSLDSSATSMTGLDWRMTVEKRRGRHWTGSIWAAQVTPGFEINDLGFSSRQEVLDGGLQIRYQEIEPGELFRSYEVTFSTYHNWSHDALKDALSLTSWRRAHVGGSFNLSGELEFLNYWRFEASASVRPTTMDRTATRGGPLMANPRSYAGRLELQTDSRRRLSVGSSVNYDWAHQRSGRDFGVSLSLEYRPSSQVEIEIEPEWSRSTIGAQYIGRSDAVPYAATYGSRYVFADLERTEFSFETRLDIAFTPSLSLQLFAQPLVSSGEYVAYKQLRTPETFGFLAFTEGVHALTGGMNVCTGGATCVDENNTRHIDLDGDGASDYAFGDRDFNVRSLVGNLVLRWEYRPGSTIFFVWQRRQHDRTQVGDFSFRRDIGALFSAPSENMFMIKVNYWIGL